MKEAESSGRAGGCKSGCFPLHLEVVTGTFKKKTQTPSTVRTTHSGNCDHFGKSYEFEEIVSAIYTTCVADFIRFLAPYIMKSRYVRI